LAVEAADAGDSPSLCVVAPADGVWAAIGDSDFLSDVDADFRSAGGALVIFFAMVIPIVSMCLQRDVGS
jgi:hypothetical protein